MIALDELAAHSVEFFDAALVGAQLLLEGLEK